MKRKKEIIAVLDPMCSWCWGFEPVLQRVRDTLGEEVRFSIMMGGLRSKGEQEWNVGFRTYLQDQWRKVETETGQKFNADLLARENFEYDTRPACRAVVCVRRLKGTAKAFSFFQALQKAFYLEARDISDIEVLSAIAVEENLDRQTFRQLLESESLYDETEADICKARSMGANVFPSLVLIDEEGHLCVLKGYRSFEDLMKQL